MSAFASSSRMALSLPSARLYPLARRYATAPPTENEMPEPAVRRRGRPATSDVDLVAPPDPLSNIRPVIYASKSTRPTSKSSPYSTGEFPYSEGDASLQDLELEWRLRRERVDVANHRFWSSINSEFNAHLANRLAALPPASTPPTERDEQLRENVLNQFYADWQIANRDRQARWVKEWWRECWAELRMQGKVYMARLFRR